jgi:serine/threonine-protein kinase RsbW
MADLRSKLDPTADVVGLNPLWEVVLAEALNNIVEHAYRESPDGEIEVRLRVHDSTIHATFRDYGQPMPNGKLPEGTLASIDVATADLPEGGFGWYLIRTNTRNLTYRYDPVNACNHLSLEIPLVV